MAGIMADHNVEGHFVVLLRLWTSEAWRAVWESLQLAVESFERLGIPHDISDHELWQICQQREIILLTANRHDEGPDSLEATIRALNVPSSLPVLTIADPELVLVSRDYAERVAIQVLGDFRKRLYCDRVRLLRGVSREVNLYRFREIVSWPGSTLRLHFISR